MNVWQKQSVRWCVGDKRVPAGTPGAVKRVELSKRFYGTLRLSDGRSKQVPLSEDHDASEMLLRRLQTEADRDRALGITQAEKQRTRPLSELVTEYASHLRSKADTEATIAKTVARLRTVFTATKATTVADLDSGRIARTLAVWREAGPPERRPGRKRTPIGVNTSNHYTRSLRAFSRWLWTEGKATEDVLRSLRALNANADRRHVRRSLTPHELRLLVDAARSGKAIRGKTWRMTPDDRAWLYVVAAFTGLRASELASLTRSSFDLGAGTVTVKAAYSKRRRTDVLPLHGSLAGPLSDWLGAKPSDAPLWPGAWAGMAASIVRRDLRRAGIAYRDDAGRVADFHALRHTFVTALARSGVHPSIAKELARHSTITLTMDAYTHAETESLRRSLDSVPGLTSVTSAVSVARE